jgi:hypothetical protein
MGLVVGDRPAINEASISSGEIRLSWFVSMAFQSRTSFAAAGAAFVFALGAGVLPLLRLCARCALASIVSVEG